MILPVSLNNFSNNINRKNIPYKNNTITASDNKMRLSGYKNPMKSYISFGWCTAHYQAMYEIDEKYTQKINNKLKEIENLKNKIAGQKEKYSIVDKAAIEAAKIIAQYANMQCVIAEVPPAYAVMNGGKLKQAMHESETLSNPISCLITINSLANMNVKNEALDEKHLERGKGATQLYAMAILLNQVDANKNKPEFAQNKDKIDELTSIVKKSLCTIYGDGILEKIEQFGAMDKNPTREQKAQALDFLVEVDSKAKNVELPEDFQQKLQILINKQNKNEGRTLDTTEEVKNSFVIKIQYPDHEHSLAHAHGVPHSHDEHHHTHNSEYQTILDNLHSHKPVENQNNVSEQEKFLLKENIQGEQK